jgi:predicted amidohydrolase YtcJ
MPSDDTMRLMAANKIAITQQPNFTYTLEGRYVEYLDGDRLMHNNSLRSPMNHGIHVAISSDILPIGPMVGIYAAVTRKGMSGAAYGAEEEALTVLEALRAYTQQGAWMTFEEDEKGSIEVGKLADLIVLDKDILSIDPDHIMNIQVDQTWLGGRLVYQRPGT